MENKNIFYIPERNERICAHDYDSTSTQMQFLKDSLENSVSLMNGMSLNDSLNRDALQATNKNNLANMTNLALQNFANKEEISVEIEELSTEEKTRFSNNLKDLKKSYVIRTSQNSQNLNLCQSKYNLQENINLYQDYHQQDYNYNSGIQSILNEASLACSLDNNDETAKLSYKFVSKRDIEITEDKIHLNKKKDETTEIFFWFAAYDKLINTKNLKKIFDFFALEDVEKKLIIKEQPIILKDFEIYFDISTYAIKPFIRQKQDSFVFLKLYYLSIQSLKNIYNYINKTEQDFSIENFCQINLPGDNLDLISLGRSSKINQPQINKNNSYPYSNLICLGSFLNTNIYTFTYNNSLGNQIHSNPNNLQPSHQLKLSLNTYMNPLLSNPSKDYLKNKIKTIVKIIKYLSASFPNYSTEFFTYHLYSRSGINSVSTPSKHMSMSNKDKNYLQIQLTEIKSHLNKKKLKNKEIKKSENSCIGKLKTVNILSSKSLKTNTNNYSSHSTVNNNIKLKNININTSIKKNSFNSINTYNSINFNSFRSYHINHNHSKTICTNPILKNTEKNNSQTQTNKNLRKLKDVILTDSNEMCNTNFSPHPKFNDTTGNETQNTGNSKIYVVARDSNMRFKTEFEESLESSLSIDEQYHKEDKANITINEECFNTPTKKRILRYYS